MPAGSLLFFSPHTVHGSEPNESDQPRRALLFTYQPGGERMFKRDGIRDAGRAALSARGSGCRRSRRGSARRRAMPPQGAISGERPTDAPPFLITLNR